MTFKSILIFSDTTISINAFPDDKFKTPPKQKNLKFDETGVKYSKKVEKGEIALLFLLFPQCFKRFVLQTCTNQQVLLWQGRNYIFTTQPRLLTTSPIEDF